MFRLFIWSLQLSTQARTFFPPPSFLQFCLLAKCNKWLHSFPFISLRCRWRWTSIPHQRLPHFVWLDKYSPLVTTHLCPLDKYFPVSDFSSLSNRQVFSFGNFPSLSIGRVYPVSNFSSLSIGELDKCSSWVMSLLCPMDKYFPIKDFASLSIWQVFLVSNFPSLSFGQVFPQWGLPYFVHWTSVTL